MNFYKSKAFHKATSIYKKIATIHPILTQVEIEVTKACNLHCLGCRRVWEGNIDRIPGDAHLTVEFLKHIVDQFPVYVPRGFKVMKFGGDGEVYCNPHLKDIMLFLKKNHVRFTSNTNGTLINTEWLKVLEDCGVIWQSVSFTGATKETFEKYRTGAEFGQVLRNAYLMGKTNIPFYINYLMLTREVFDEIPEAIRLAQEVGATGIAFLKPQLSDDKIFTPPDFPNLRSELADYKALVEASGLWYEGLLNPLPIFSGCWDTFTGLRVTLNGDVYPCMVSMNQRPTEWYMGEVTNTYFVEDYLMGNLHRDNLKAIWNGKDMNALRDKLRHPAYPIGTIITCEQLAKIKREAMRDRPDRERFSYCDVCLTRWSESGTARLK